MGAFIGLNIISALIVAQYAMSISSKEHSAVKKCALVTLAALVMLTFGSIVVGSVLAFLSIRKMFGGNRSWQ